MTQVTSKDGLTNKQRESLRRYIDPSSPTYLNATESVKGVYDVKDDRSAGVVGHLLVKNHLTKFKETLEDKKSLKWLTAEYVLNGINSIIRDKTTRKDIKLKALETLGRFKNLSLFRDVTVNESIDSKQERVEDIDAEFKSFIQERKANKAEIIS